MNEWKIRYWRIQPMKVAPNSTPVIDPIPPNITSTTTKIETCKAKSDGKIEPSFADESTPATPEVLAPIAKAMTLYFRLLIPSDLAASSSSRMAAHERPTFEWFNELKKKRMGMMNANNR